MDPKIAFHNNGTPYRLRGKRSVARWVALCVGKERLTAGEINYIFCSGDVHLAMNLRFLGHDYRTDVITFDYTVDGVVSGDIYIDVETVRDNARQYGETSRREMLRVIIHGILHLCGYKDKTEQESLLMRSKEEECLALVDFE